MSKSYEPTILATATAVPSQQQSVPVIQATPVEQRNQYSAAQNSNVVGSRLVDDIGVCRRCGSQFVRPPNAHDGVASYYRCNACNRLFLEDFCTVM
jgi:hypothetical protein